MQIIASVVPIEPPKQYTLIVSQEELDLITSVLETQVSLPTSADMVSKLKPLQKNNQMLVASSGENEVI
jgi:hypothetical protein